MARWGCRPEWRDHLRGLEHDVRFFHRQDFRRAYPALANLPLPAILLDAKDPRVLLNAATLNAMHDAGELIEALDRALCHRRRMLTAAR